MKEKILKLYIKHTEREREWRNVELLFEYLNFIYISSALTFNGDKQKQKKVEKWKIYKIVSPLATWSALVCYVFLLCSMPVPRNNNKLQDKALKFYLILCTFFSALCFAKRRKVIFQIKIVLEAFENYVLVKQMFLTAWVWTSLIKYTNKVAITIYNRWRLTGRVQRLSQMNLNIKNVDLIAVGKWQFA